MVRLLTPICQLSYPNRHCLARRFNNGNVRNGVLGTMQGAQYSTSIVQGLLTRPNYLSFSNDVEEGPHDAIHNVIAGDMAAAFSPNDAMVCHKFYSRLFMILMRRLVLVAPSAD